jgi:4'-phosphopantetheinyl transferase
MKKKLNSIESAIEVWNIHLPCVRDQLSDCRNVLTPDEKQRADRFINPADAERFILCRGLLRRTLADYLEQKPADLCFSHNENGKPFLKESNLSFNVSHSRDRLLIAVTCARAVGVDIEFRRDGVQMTPIADRWFSPAEREFFQGSENPHNTFFDIWSKKEAYVKALGEGIFRDLNSFTVPFGNDPKVPDIGTINGWFFQTLEIDPAYAAALVSEAPPVPVQLRTIEV